MAERDDNPRSETIVRVIALFVLGFTIFLGAQPNVQIPFFVYCILGGVILGVTDLKTLLSGISFSGNNKKDN